MAGSIAALFASQNSVSAGYPHALTATVVLLEGMGSTQVTPILILSRLNVAAAHALMGLFVSG
jgi:hypothetical protein